MSNTRITANIWRVLTIRILLASLLSLTGVSSATAASPTDPGYFPNAPLQNQDGETLHFYDDVIKGKVVTINFMFTSCGDSCPMETAKLRKIQEMLGEHAGKDVYMYSVTVDPERDTPAKLKAYMQKFNIGPGWQFLTGKKADIDEIRKKLAMYSDEEEVLSDHPITFVLGNEATGQWLKRTPFDLPETLISVLLGRLQQHKFTASMAQASYAQTHALPPARTGEDLFNTRCTACHTIGQGDRLGPDLLDVVSKRDRAWLVRWLQEPDVMLREQDPLATALFNQYDKVPMPNLKLTDRNTRDLIEFLQTESQQVHAAATASNPQAGNQLESILEPESLASTKTSPAQGNKPVQDQARADETAIKEVN
jgi:protein SCO1/2